MQMEGRTIRIIKGPHHNSCINSLRGSCFQVNLKEESCCLIVALEVDFGFIGIVYGGKCRFRIRDRVCFCFCTSYCVTGEPLL